MFLRDFPMAFLLVQICTQLLGMSCLHIFNKFLHNKYILYKYLHITCTTRKRGN